MQELPPSKWFPAATEPVSYGAYLIRMKSPPLIPHKNEIVVYPLALAVYKNSKWLALNFSTYEYEEVSNVTEWTYIP